MPARRVAGRVECREEVLSNKSGGVRVVGTAPPLRLPFAAIIGIGIDGPAAGGRRRTARVVIVGIPSFFRVFVRDSFATFPVHCGGTFPIGDEGLFARASAFHKEI
jgi:hypothetical protein